MSDNSPAPTDDPSTDPLTDPSTNPSTGELVANPTVVVLRLDTPTIGAYRYLAESLGFAAVAANDASAMATSASPQASADLRTVRDALRRGATDALVGRSGRSTSSCRRCGTACTHCAPPEVTP